MKRLWLFAACLGLLVVACNLTGARTAAKPVQVVRHSLSTPPVEASTSTAASLTQPLPATLRTCAELLTTGHRWLETVPDYTAVFRKQERVGDELHPLEVTELKLRHAPFSVAMTWNDNGRIVYYREGHDRNRMTVRMGGWKRRFGWVHLDPHSTLAMNESRYPITDAGIMRLTEQLQERFAPYLDHAEGVRCEWLPDEAIGGRRCRVFTVEYASTAVNPDYRKTLVWLDTEWSVPLSVQNFDWQTDDPSNPEGLVEYYVYENIHLANHLADSDFTVDGQTPVAEVAETRLGQP